MKDLCFYMYHQNKPEFRSFLPMNHLSPTIIRGVRLLITYSTCQAIVPATVPDILSVDLIIYIILCMYCVLHQLGCFYVKIELPLCQVHYVCYHLLLVPHSASTYCGSCCHHCSNCCSCRTAPNYFNHPDLHCYLVSHEHHMTVT